MDRLKNFRNRKPPSSAILVPTYGRWNILKNTLLEQREIIDDQMNSDVQSMASSNCSAHGAPEVTRPIAKRHAWGQQAGARPLPWLLGKLDPVACDETVTLLSDWRRREFGQFRSI